MLVKEAISFQKTRDPKHAIFGLISGQVVVDEETSVRRLNRENEYYAEVWIVKEENPREHYALSMYNLGKIVYNQNNESLFFRRTPLKLIGQVFMSVKNHFRIINKEEKETIKQFLTKKYAEQLVEITQIFPIL